MIIERRKLLSYRCPFCGSVKYEPFSIFDFQRGCKLVRLCNCRKSALQAYKDRHGRYLFEIPCIACGSIHEVKFSERSLWDRSINCILCDKTNTEISYIGNHTEVHGKVDSFEKEIDELIYRLGYNDYFKNVRIMLEVLNKIHDLAEEGSVICECGSSNVELILHSNRVKISCKACCASIYVYARTSQDLADLNNCRSLLILGQACKKFGGR